MYQSQPTGAIPQGEESNSREEQPASSQGLGGVDWYVVGIRSLLACKVVM